jgi:hypothetical protein
MTPAQLPPPVEVMRTVVAVTDPLVAAGPNALTQSPTARSPGEADCVALTVVELDVVIFSACVLGGTGFLVLVLVCDVEFPEAARRGKLPGDSVKPEIVTVDPVTAVTLPAATESDASCLRKLLAPEPPSGKRGREPFAPWPEPPTDPFPVRNWNPAGGPLDDPPAARAPGPVHKALAAGAVTVMLRAAIVVLDLFVDFPVTETQSPTASALTASVAVLENRVVVVQLTVVCPLLGFCTSMLEPFSAATLPDAPVWRFGVAVAAPAAVAAVTVSSTVVPAPSQ